MMRKTLLTGLMLVVGLLVTACNTAPAPQTAATPAATPSLAEIVASAAPKVDLTAEIAALKSGDTATTIAGLEKILSSNPTSAEAHLLLGQAYYRADQKEKAEQEFMAAFGINSSVTLPLESQDADEWLKVGNAHASLAQLEEALAAYQTVLKIKPDKAAAYTNIGVVYYQAGQYDTAVQQMQKALEIEPDDAETYYMLGATYVQQKKLDEAEKSFNKAIELKPDLAAAYTGLGNVQLANKKFEESVATLQKATTLQPDQAEAWLALGQAYAAQGNKSEASQALNQCVQLSQPGPLRDRCQQELKNLSAP